MNAWNNGVKTEIDDKTIKFLMSPKNTEMGLTDDVHELHLDDFIFSPKKENKKHKTGENSAKRGKKRLFCDTTCDTGNDSKRMAMEEEGLEKWQKDVVANFREYFKSEKTWEKSDFELLANPSISGSAAYLNDRIFHYVLLLMKKQFPHIQGLQDTVDYKHCGLKRVSPPAIFLQPAHSGALHWTLLTNIPLSEKEREEGNKVCVFDSMVHLSKRSELEADIPCAVLWQAAQIHRKKHWKEAVPIDVYGMPCPQQENGHDCGMHVVMNMVALAFGYNPSKIVYKSDGRRELLKMICDGKLSMFAHENYDENGKHRSKFTVLTTGKLQKRVQLKKTTKTMLPFCHCQLPESWDNVVFCSKCNGMYHQRCHFMGPSARGRSIADTMENFVCFSCRKPGEYKDFLGNQVLPNYGAIEEVANKIDQLESYKLCAHYHFLINEKSNVPTNLREYETLQAILAKFDLNTLSESSPNTSIYVSLKNFHNRYASMLPKEVVFDEVGVTKMTLFAIAVICDVMEEECPPVFTKQLPITVEDDLASLYSCNKSWVSTIESSLQIVGKKVQVLNSKIPPQKAQDFLSYIITELRELRQKITSLNLTLAEVKEVKATTKHKNWRQEATLQCITALRELDSLEEQVGENTWGNVLYLEK